MPPTAAHTITKHNALVIDLNTSSQRAYAQALATAIKSGMSRAEPRRTNEPPPFRTTGATLPKPRVVEAFHPGHDKARVQPARIYLGNGEYQEALGTLHQDQWDAWWDWLADRYDRWGDLLMPPLLFRSRGDRFVPNEHTSEPEQAAALWVLSFAWIDLLEETGGSLDKPSGRSDRGIVVSSGGSSNCAPAHGVLASA